MRKIIAKQLADQVADWGHRGLIDKDLSTLLNRRYSVDASMRQLLLRWLGFLAAFMLGMSVIGLVSMSLGEIAAYISPFAVGVLGYCLWLKGTRMATDPEQQYPTSGAVLVTVGLICLFAAQLLLYAVFGGRDIQFVFPAMMLITAAAAFFTAYRFGLRWPLVLGVLLVFHAIGHMHSYVGHGGYFMAIQDERLTLLAAVAAIVLGMWHEQVVEKDLGRRAVGSDRLISSSVFCTPIFPSGF